MRASEIGTPQKPGRKRVLNFFHCLQPKHVEISLQIDEKTRIVESLQETQLAEAERVLDNKEDEETK